MNDSLKNFIEQYAELECGVKELISKASPSLCGQCTRCCCDVIHCKEAIKSPFLRQVHQQTDQFHATEGFLSDKGCRLSKGRPFICYEYFCDDHFYHQPDELHAEVLKIIGALPYHATRQAEGHLPLEEILQEEALDQLDFSRLEKQMQESLQALEIIRTFYREGTLPEAAYKTLQRIQFSEN